MLPTPAAVNPSTTAPTTNSIGTAARSALIPRSLKIRIELPPSTAVIAAERCATLFGLHILERRIQDLKFNFTTFVAASRLHAGDVGGAEPKA